MSYVFGITIVHILFRCLTLRKLIKMKKSQIVLSTVVLIFFTLSFSAYAQRGRQRNPNPPCFSQNRTFIGKPYPKPCSTLTKFDLSIHKERYFTIDLYDQAGNVVKKIYDGNLKPGTHSFTIEASSLKQGRYFIVAKREGFPRSRPVIFMS